MSSRNILCFESYRAQKTEERAQRLDERTGDRPCSETTTDRGER